MLIFGGTVNVVPWVYGPEILPLEARTRGTAISVSSHWLWNFFIVMICKSQPEDRLIDWEADQVTHSACPDQPHRLSHLHYLRHSAGMLYTDRLLLLYALHSTLS